MATAVQSLPSLIAAELIAVDQCFADELRSELPNVNQLITHVGKFRGKMLRPMLVLLSGLATANGGPADKRAGGTLGAAAAGGAGSPLTPAHITLATVVEMVHIATLVHDDILDSAEVRRKGATINHLHGNEAAVLLGDYLISHAYHLCSSLQSQDYSRLIAHTTNVVCEGELTQNFNRRNWKLSEATYFDIIYRKTAILTETCCRIGAMVSAENDPGGAAWIDALATFGKKAGMAFQIVDDILDICGQQKTVGKSLGTDIEKGKLTLPMIHFLKHAAAQHRALLIDLLESDEVDRIERVRQLLSPSESILFAKNTAEGLVSQAIQALSILPRSEARDVLVEMAHFITARER